MKKLLLLAVTVCFAAAAHSQDFPNKPIRVLVPFAPGGAVDTTARVLAQAMQQRVNWQFVIENRPGGNGFIATTAVAKAPADGYTLLMASFGPLYVNTTLYSKLTYDIVRDFEPVTQISFTPNIVALHPSLPLKSVPELIAYARANPGKLRYGSAGSGSSQHLSAELFKSMAGVDLQHVPYKSSSQMTNELLGGQIELAFQNAPLVLGYVKAGKLRGLAVTTRSRLAAAPELPTLDESGLKGYEMGGGSGLLAPKGTPSEILKKLELDVRAAIHAVREQYAANGLIAVGSSSAEFAANLKSEIARLAALIRATGAKVE